MIKYIFSLHEYINHNNEQFISSGPGEASADYSCLRLRIQIRWPEAAAPSPHPGVSLGIGNSQTLTATFIRLDSVDYQQVTASTTIDVLPNEATTAMLQFAAATFSADIAAGTAQIILSRVGRLATAVSVVLSSPGASDIAAFQQTVTTSAGAASATVSIPLRNDGRPHQADEAISLSLSRAAKWSW